MNKAIQSHVIKEQDRVVFGNQIRQAVYAHAGIIFSNMQTGLLVIAAVAVRFRKLCRDYVLASQSFCAAAHVALRNPETKSVYRIPSRVRR